MTSGKVATTLGYERRNNPALRFADRAAFVAFMNADQPVRPANIGNIVAINQGLRPLTMEAPSAPALDPAAVAGLRERGHIVLDTRSSAAFGQGHLPGSYHVHLTSPEFEQRVGWVTPVDVPIVLVVQQDAEVARALHALAFVGLDARVKGYLAGGLEAWARAGYPIDTIEQISVHDLQERLGTGRLRVLDVRERVEWAGGHIAGAHLMSYKHLPARLAELPFSEDAIVAVVCHSGARSSTAASILRRQGFRQVLNVTGGIVAWSGAGLPMVDGAGCAVARR